MDTAPTHLETPFGAFALRRYPVRPRETLQAWCAADTLLIDEVYQGPASADAVLVANDDFGSLCLALSPLAFWTDSSLAVTALRRNEQANTARATPVIWSTDAPPTQAQLVVLRVPKNLPYFRYQLATLAATLAPGARVIAGGMDKHLSRHTATAMEQWLGPTLRHPGKRKARIFSTVLQQPPPRSVEFNSAYRCDFLGGEELVALPNVFSGAALDIGSRFLLSHLQSLAPADTVVDLACGNGVLGLAAYKAGLARRVVFCDESAMAIASARMNAARLFPDAGHDFVFAHGDGLAGAGDVRADLILCNPPFHLGHVVDEYAGRRLLAQCPGHMAPGGRLCLVANRHLQYGPALARGFHNVSTLAGNSKFSLYLADSPR